MRQGLIIKKLRNKTGLSQAALAEKIGVGQPYISEIEISRKKMSPDTLEKACKALGISIGAFTLLSLEISDFKKDVEHRLLFDSIKENLEKHWQF